MGFFGDWMKARMYRKQVEKGMRNVISEFKDRDTGDDDVIQECSFTKVLKVSPKYQKKVYDYLVDDAKSDKIKIKEEESPKIFKYQMRDSEFRLFTVCIKLKEVNKRLVFSTNWKVNFLDAFHKLSAKEIFEDKVDEINELFGKKK